MGLLSLADEEEGANGEDRAGKVIEAQLVSFDCSRSV